MMPFAIPWNLVDGWAQECLLILWLHLALKTAAWIVSAYHLRSGVKS